MRILYSVYWFNRARLAVLLYEFGISGVVTAALQSTGLCIALSFVSPEVSLGWLVPLFAVSFVGTFLVVSSSAILICLFVYGRTFEFTETGLVVRGFAGLTRRENYYRDILRVEKRYSRGGVNFSLLIVSQRNAGRGRRRTCVESIDSYPDFEATLLAHIAPMAIEKRTHRFRRYPGDGLIWGLKTKK